MIEMNRLTRLRTGNVGSLGFLPIEVCNNIYAYLLAEFQPFDAQNQLTGTTLEEQMETFHHVPHSIDTAILRASRDVHREAYDLLIKENRFVHLKCQVLPRILMTTGFVPMVTVNTEHVRQFKGYVLEVNASYGGEQMPHQFGGHGTFEAMMLAANLDGFCQSLMVGNVIPEFSNHLTLKLNLGPMIDVDRKARDYEDLESLEAYFTEKTQKELLRPLRDNLHGVRDVQICGLVSADVVSSTLKTVASGKWGGPQHVLDHLATRKEIGMKLFRENKQQLASHSWTQDILEIDILRNGGDWPKFVDHGGEQFIHQVAEIYFQISLNCAHISLGERQKEAFAYKTKNFLLHASRALTAGYWKAGFTWRPSDELEAKLHFRTARFLRLRGDLDDVRQAMDELDEALRLHPGDPVILRERQLVSEWVFEAAV